VTTTVTASRTPAALADAVRDDASLRRFLHGLPGVDQVGVERRSAVLATRSIKKGSKLQAIDMVIDRGAYLSGRYGAVYDEIVAVKEACGSAHLKVILETGELAGYDDVRRASWLALLAGADVIKTSTGKVSPAATLPVTLVMLEAVRDFRTQTGRLVGVKAAGGIRNAKDAIRYLVLVNETCGDDWLTPDAFRFGASSLLNDLLMQRQKLATGRYAGPDYFTLD
jgi:deoxyribose-phosphate aldolase